jgi:hypothetical protein
MMASQPTRVAKRPIAGKITNASGLVPAVESVHAWVCSDRMLPVYPFPLD